MSLLIGFSALKVHCSIGIYPHEKRQLQDIFISLKVRLPRRPSTISETIDYSLLAEICTALTMEKHHDLIESLAIVLLDAIFSRFACTYGWIRIEKPGAISPACAFVEYEKEN